MSTPIRAIEGILGMPHTPRPTKSDSVIEAEENLRLALDHPDGYLHLGTSDLIALAHANATLALVEQQRIANLIAFQNSFPFSQKVADAIRAEVERGVGLL